MLLVNIKWGKELFKDVEVDLNGTAADFRQQLFSLSNVTPENQKGAKSISIFLVKIISSLDLPTQYLDAERAIKLFLLWRALDGY